ncbi:DUF4178 domain-containing protein [Nocardiopsis sediminis]|uniref:DUF4178 domain-containing protein n=1 Tax=Nocardiopsis sediminis TaxID=1778267 RepID=A0ABV8FS43_9ACTN
MVLIIAVAVAGVAGVAFLVGRARSQPAPPPPKPDPTPRDPFADLTESSGDPTSLKAGDMLEFGTERSWIRGTLRLAEGGSVWAEHFLEIDEGRRWLSVEEDPDVKMALWTGRPELDLTPHSKTIELEGVRYRLTERGTASYRSEGTTGLRAKGGMDYADYEGPGGRLLAFERFDHGKWEPSVGTALTPGSFTIYPAG